MYMYTSFAFCLCIAFLGFHYFLFFLSISINGLGKMYPASANLLPAPAIGIKMFRFSSSQYVFLIFGKFIEFLFIEGYS